MKRPCIVFHLVASISVVFAASAAAQDIMLDKDKAAVGKREYSPYLTRGYPNRVYFGDTHLHTLLFDGRRNVRHPIGPRRGLSLRARRGGDVEHRPPARLQRPLDFLVVSDHAENLGLAPTITESNPELLKTQWGRMVHDFVKQRERWRAYNAW